MTEPAATVLQIVATLALTFVIGLEREERVARDRTLVGGVRTIPIRPCFEATYAL